MESIVWCLNTCTLCNNKIKVINIAITYDIYNFFVLETFKILSVSYFEIVK